MDFTAQIALEKGASDQVIFDLAVNTVDELQDSIDWDCVKPKWKSTAARWAKALKKCTSGAGRGLCLALLQILCHIY